MTNKEKKDKVSEFKKIIAGIKRSKSDAFRRTEKKRAVMIIISNPEFKDIFQPLLDNVK